MSDSAGGPRAWAFYLDDMIGFTEKVLAYTAGLDQDRFIREDLVYDATLRNLELIGEAATHIPESVRAANPDVPPSRRLHSRQPSGRRASRISRSSTTRGHCAKPSRLRGTRPH